MKGCGVGANPGDNIFFLLLGNRRNQLSPMIKNQWVTWIVVGAVVEWWSGCMGYEVKEILGHADIKTTMMYAHIFQRLRMANENGVTNYG